MPPSMTGFFPAYNDSGTIASMVEGTVSGPSGTAVKDALVVVYPPIMERGETLRKMWE